MSRGDLTITSSFLGGRLVYEETLRFPVNGRVVVNIVIRFMIPGEKETSLVLRCRSILLSTWQDILQKK